MHTPWLFCVVEDNSVTIIPQICFKKLESETNYYITKRQVGYNIYLCFFKL